MGEWTRRDEVGAQTQSLPCDVWCALSLFSLSSLWVLRRSGDGREEGCGGGDWLAGPTSPVDREQMGPDSLHTNHCQESFGLLQWPFQNDDNCLLKQGESPGLREWGKNREITVQYRKNKLKVGIIQGVLPSLAFRLELKFVFALFVKGSKMSC